MGIIDEGGAQAVAARCPLGGAHIASCTSRQRLQEAMMNVARTFQGRSIKIIYLCLDRRVSSSLNHHNHQEPMNIYFIFYSCIYIYRCTHILIYVIQMWKFIKFKKWNSTHHHLLISTPLLRWMKLSFSKRYQPMIRSSMHLAMIVNFRTSTNTETYKCLSLQVQSAENSNLSSLHCIRNMMKLSNVWERTLIWRT